jgi:subfamily B ATP-binding cassette protein MsbA
VMERGRIIESGRHAELLAHDGQYAVLYNMQFQDKPE